MKTLYPVLLAYFFFSNTDFVNSQSPVTLQDTRPIKADKPTQAEKKNDLKTVEQKKPLSPDSKEVISACIEELVKNINGYSECETACNNIYIGAVLVSITKEYSDEEKFKSLSRAELYAVVQNKIIETDYKETYDANKAALSEADIYNFRQNLAEIFGDETAVNTVVEEFRNASINLCFFRTKMDEIGKSAKDMRTYLRHIKISETAITALVDNTTTGTSSSTKPIGTCYSGIVNGIQIKIDISTKKVFIEKNGKSRSHKLIVTNNSTKTYKFKYKCLGHYTFTIGNGEPLSVERRFNSRCGTLSETSQ